MHVSSRGGSFGMASEEGRNGANEANRQDARQSRACSGAETRRTNPFTPGPRGGKVGPGAKNDKRTEPNEVIGSVRASGKSRPGNDRTNRTHRELTGLVETGSQRMGEKCQTNRTQRAWQPIRYEPATSLRPRPTRHPLRPRRRAIVARRLRMRWPRPRRGTRAAGRPVVPGPPGRRSPAASRR
jgi:hypothetical protein